MGLFNKSKDKSIANELKGALGESLAKMIANFDIPRALVLKDILIDGYNGNTSQIDMILINAKGIYVVEVKLYPDAIIYGDGKRRTWYYYKYKQKYELYSPMMQNKNHIKYLKKFLSSFGDIPYFSVIALLCKDYNVSNVNEDFYHRDTVIVNGLLSLSEAVSTISKGKPDVLTKTDQQAIAAYIYNNQYKGKEKRRDHKKAIINLKKEIEDKEFECPFCKSPLVLRNGIYGEFYGCSNYPNCRYTKSVKY